MEEIPLISFKSIAKPHTQYWKDETLKKHTWLKGASQMSSKRENDWKVAHEYGTQYWEKIVVKIAAIKNDSKYNDKSGKKNDMKNENSRV